MGSVFCFQKIKMPKKMQSGQNSVYEIQKDTKIALEILQYIGI